MRMLILKRKGTLLVSVKIDLRIILALIMLFSQKAHIKTQPEKHFSGCVSYFNQSNWSSILSFKRSQKLF